MMHSSATGASGVLSLRSLAWQLLVALPFAGLLAANFVITSVPDYRPAGLAIRIDTVFPRDWLRDRDDIVTGSQDEIHYRFRCSPRAGLRVGAKADLLVDSSGLHFSIPACADLEQRAATRARWSAWAACSLALFILLSWIRPDRRVERTG